MTSLTNERITTRMSSEMKDLLEQALSLSGYASLNSFIAHAAVAEAKRLIEQNMRIKLCQEDALAFINSLEQPVNMNDRFLRAARKHKETVSVENSSAEISKLITLCTTR